MKSRILTATLCFWFCSAVGQEKDVNIHSSTTAGSQSRYEIVQSTLAAKWTFRLDKYCGSISQLVSTEDGGTAWQSMPVLGLPKCPKDGKTRYQIFVSGLAARHTFLLNTENGKTWVVQSVKGENGEEGVLWGEFEK